MSNQAGKGDKWRKGTNFRKYQENWPADMGKKSGIEFDEIEFTETPTDLLKKKEEGYSKKTGCPSCRDTEDQEKVDTKLKEEDIEGWVEQAMEFRDLEALKEMEREEHGK